MRFSGFSISISGSQRSGGMQGGASAENHTIGRARGGVVSASCSFALSMRTILVFLVAVFGGATYVDSQQLKMGFYKTTCPSAEKLARDTMTVHFRGNANVAAHILRLHFHDCAATGCDASVLLTGAKSEQNAPPNLSLRGFDVIDDIKFQLEGACPGVVSCADVLTMAARDAVFLTGGPFYSVPLGRFDSKNSGGTNVNLPTPSVTVGGAIGFFRGLGLTTLDMVTLLGAHTIGQSHCTSFADRLYNFQNSGSPDPTIDPPYLAKLQKSCPQKAKNNAMVEMDLSSGYTFDNHYFTEMIKQHGVLSIDQELHENSFTTRMVDQMAMNATFFAQSFAQSMIKLGQINVLDGKSGWIRRNCGG